MATGRHAALLRFDVLRGSAAAGRVFANDTWDESKSIEHVSEEPGIMWLYKVDVHKT